MAAHISQYSPTAPRRAWQSLAEKGHIDAQFNLGLLNEHGLGVPQDAASQDDVGLFYAMGRGVAPSGVLAVAWLTVALENGAKPTDLLEQLKANLNARDLKEAGKLVEEMPQQCRPPS